MIPNVAMSQGLPSLSYQQFSYLVTTPAKGLIHLILSSSIYMALSASHSALGKPYSLANLLFVCLLGMLFLNALPLYAQERDVDQHEKIGSVHHHGESDHGQSDAYWAEKASRYLPFLVDEEEARYVPVELLNSLGVWGPVINWPHIPVSAANLPDGRILSFSSNKEDAFPVGPEFTYAATWDPATNQFVDRPHNSHDMFCGHLVMLDDGRVFINGGRNTVNTTSVFDANANSWSVIDPMVDPRWYPTTIAMPDGRVFTASGNGGPNTAERWTPNQGWQKLNGIDWSSIAGANGFESHWWPYLFINNDGTLFHAGPTDDMHNIDPNGNGTLTNLGTRLSDNWYPKHAAVVMYAPGKILIAGGSSQHSNTVSTNRAITIDINGPTPVVTEIAPMEHARRFNSAVMLPNGEVMVLGGNTSGVKFSDQGTILPTEIWNPTTGQWRTVASMSVPRNYHSIGLLLPDATVLAAGGGLCGNCTANHQDGQVYSPAYLFNPDGSPASRPAINQAPSAINHSQTFTVQATGGVSQFSLIKLSATTHAVNTDLRFLDVPFVPNGTDSYELTAHANANILTPGYYMLFALDAQGVPSVAHTIRVNPVGTNTAPVLTNPGTQATLLGTSVDLLLSALDADGDNLTFSDTGLPPGLNLNPGTGRITGTPSATGLYPVTITVDDGNGGVDIAQFNWVVNDTPTAGAIGEAGTVINAQPDANTWHTVNLQRTYANPIVVMQPPSANDGDPVTVRVRNVTGSSFQYQLDEWEYQDGSHGTEAVGYFVVDTGTHDFVSGFRIQAGSAEAGSTRSTVTFPTPFSGPMVVFSQVTTTNDPEAVVTRHANPSQNDFDIEIHARESNKSHGTETVHWIAVSSGTSTAGTLDVLANVTSDTYTHDWRNISLSPGFASTPVFLAAMQRIDGGDTAGLRFRNLTGNDVEVKIDEEQSNDTETNHTTEPIGFLAIEAGTIDAFTNTPPELTNPGNQTNQDGDAVALTLSATDADGDNLTYGASGLPDGLSINPNSGLISGIPTTATTANVTITADDGNGGVDTEAFTWTIIAAPGSWLDFADETASRLTLSSLPANDNEEKDLAVGDLNNDGWEDIVVVRKPRFMNTGTIKDAILINNNGILQDQTDLYAPAFSTHMTDARDVMIRDLNNDGWNDVVIATTFEDPPALYLNRGEDGQGQWLGLADESARLPDMNVSPAQFCGVSSGDINADGFPDLYFSNYAPDGTAQDVLLINDGTGTFTDESDARLGALRSVGFSTSAAWVDMDGDGDIDLVRHDDRSIQPFGLPGVYLFFNDGTGTFNTWQRLIGNAPYMFAVADFNADTKHDLYVVDDGQDLVALGNAVVPNTSLSFIERPLTSARTAGFGGNLQVADLDQDGDLDVGLADVDSSNPPCDTGNSPRKFALFQNDGTGQLTDPWGSASNPWNQNTFDFGFLDIDRDGDLDFFAAGCTGYSIYVNTDAPPNQPPTLTNPGNQTHTVGDTASLTLSANDPDGDSITYGASGLPPGLNLNTSSGQITGTPSTAGSYNVTASADDGNGGTDSETFTWTINPDDPPPTCGPSDEIILLSDLSWSYTYFRNDVAPGSEFSFNAARTGQDFFGQQVGESALFVLIDGDLNPSLPLFCDILVPGAVFGDLKVVSATPHDNNGTCALRALTLKYKSDCGSGNQPPALTNPGNQLHTVGDTIDLTLSASDPEGDALTYGANNLPPGLSINSASGQITGSPTTAGSYAVSVSVDDGNGGSDSEAFNWIINTEGGGGPECANPEEIIALSDPSWSYRYFQASVDPGDTFSLASAPTGQDFFGQALGESELFVRVGSNQQAGIPTSCSATPPGAVFDELAVVNTSEVDDGSGGCALAQITLHFRPQCTGTTFPAKLAGETATLNQQARPDVFALDAPYPNPFVYETVFPYAVPEPSPVRMTLFNVMGQVVAELLDTDVSAGRGQVRWDGRDAQGRSVGSGVYFARMQAGAFVQTRKVMVQR